MEANMASFDTTLIPPLNLTASARQAVIRNHDLTDRRLQLLATHELLRICDDTGRDADTLSDWLVYHTFAVGLQEFICTPQHNAVTIDTCTRVTAPSLDPERFGDEPVSVPIADTGSDEQREIDEI